MLKGITYAIMGCGIDKGMKSKGSKSLIEFNKQKLLDYQINQIYLAHQNININYEIIYITNFEYLKIEKLFKHKIDVYELENNKNPVIKACGLSKYGNIFFIDYGCVFEQSTLVKSIIKSQSTIFGSKTVNQNLDIGILSEKPDVVKSLFFDLSDDKFANMFFLCEHHVQHILNNKNLYRNNLMYFEILNSIIDEQSKNIYYKSIKNTLFIYFTNKRQKNGISKFIKKYDRYQSIL